jgi:hypothetical protein
LLLKIGPQSEGALLVRALLAGALLALSFFCLAGQQIEKPVYSEDDTWGYQVTVDNGKDKAIVHFSLKVVQIYEAGVSIHSQRNDETNRSGEKLFNSDLSFSRNIAGKQTVVDQPFNFPLEVGKQWHLEFAEEKFDAKTKLRTTALHYRAAGWETITVPAGNFEALKIVVDGAWRKELLPGPNVTSSTVVAGEQGVSVRMDAKKPDLHPATSSGRLFRTYWYVPSIKREVKSIEEDYSSEGQLHRRETSELESVKLANSQS